MHVNARRVEWGASARVGLVLVDDDVVLVGGSAWERRSCGELLRRAGMRGAPPCALAIDAEISPGARLTAVPADLRATRLALLAALAAGLMTAAARHARDYAGDRRQFGRALADIPVVAEKVERATAAASTARTEALACARAIDERLTGANADSAALAERTCTGAVRVAIDAMQVFGGYGYLTEYPLERILRDTVTLRAIAAGGLSNQHGAAS